MRLCLKGEKMGKDSIAFFFLSLKTKELEQKRGHKASWLGTEILMQGAAQVRPEDVLPNEITQTQTDKHCVIPLT